MIISVNEKDVAASGEDGQTLASLLRNLRARGAIGADQVVVELQVDDRPWGPEDFEMIDATDLCGLRSVRVATEDMRGYARRILTDARAMLAVLQESTARVAEAFRTGDPAGANGDLFNLLNAFQKFVACLWHVQNTCLLEAGPRRVDGELVAAISRCLDRLESAQQQENWSALAGALEGDFAPLLASLDPILLNMVDELRDDPREG